MTLAEVTLPVSTLGIITLSQVDIVGQGSTLYKLGVAGLLGVIALASVCAMIYQYKVGQKKDEEHAQKLYELIESSVKANTEQAEVSKQQVGILVEVKDAIMKCKQNEG